MVRRTYFSIVIPVYNRMTKIERAIRSVYDQDFPDYEIIIVDDGSTDDTARTVEGLAEARVKLLRHKENRGVCPTRNTGVAAAGGKWIVFLDSDDELVPSALERLYELTEQRPRDVHRVAGMYRWDDGSVSPDPRPNWEVLDYERYIAWSATSNRSDFHNCILRETFGRVTLPDSRAYETEYHLDFARVYRTWMVPEVVALEHQDAPDSGRNLDSRARRQRLLRHARDCQESMERILRRHGPTLRRVAPERNRAVSGMRVLFALLARRRITGCRAALWHMWEHGIDHRVLAALGAGLMSPDLLAELQAHRGR